MYFASKRDFWLGLLIWGLMLLGAVPALLKPGKDQLIIMIAVILFIGWIWFGTGYEILENELKIRCGPFRQRILIQEMNSLRSQALVTRYLPIGIDAVSSRKKLAIPFCMEHSENLY